MTIISQILIAIFKLANHPHQPYPWAEYEQAKTLVFSGDFTYHSQAVKQSIAKHLPDGVDLLVYVESEQDIAPLRLLYEDFVQKDHLKFLLVPQVEGGQTRIWARDSLPIPAIDLDSGTMLLVNAKSYLNLLRAQGCNPILMPKPQWYSQNYINSLIVNGTIFVPSFGESQDRAAHQIYQELGFKVVPINTVRLSNAGGGSIHCITMTYPH